MDGRAPLGDSGLMVSRVGLGLAALGRPGYINLQRERDLGAERSPVALRAHCHAVLDAAWLHGVRYFDAARSYGRAEEFLAEWLASRDLPAGSATVGSKWGYRYTADWQVRAEVHEIKEHTAGLLRRQWSESRGLLGDHLALYQIHSATAESGVLRNREVISELMGLRDRAGVRLGLTTSGPDQSEMIRRASCRWAGSGCSTRCRRPGTCWSHQRAAHWRRRDVPDSE
jgi:aryl-alcohol dehydrogenase-like predicted oxidoreductase